MDPTQTDPDGRALVAEAAREGAGARGLPARAPAPTATRTVPATMPGYRRRRSADGGLRRDLAPARGRARRRDARRCLGEDGGDAASHVVPVRWEAPGPAAAPPAAGAPGPG